MPTYNIQVITEADMVAGGGTVGSNGTFATAGSEFTYSAATMPWYTMEVVDNGADTTTLSADTNPSNSDGGPNSDNEGSDGETGTLFDPAGNQVGNSGRVAADRWGVLQGSDGSTIFIYEIENFDDVDVYAFSAPLVDGVTYTTVTQNTRDTPYDYGQIICLAHGTRILTPSGYHPIETLAMGDLVATADHGPQIIRWVTKAVYEFGDSPNARPDFPVHIRAGTAGNAENLVLSPQHRVVVEMISDRGFEEALVAAKLLAEEFDGRIRYAKGKSNVEFYNLVLDRHEIIIAEGAYVESFYPGPEARKSPELGAAWPIWSRFPGLWEANTTDEIEAAYGPYAREVLNRCKLRSLIASQSIRFPAEMAFDFRRAAC